MENKLRLQITEKYRRNVFINVVVSEGRLFEFEETHDIDYSFINEEVKENVE